MDNALERLRAMTAIVADTGDFLQIARFAPRDATTNPTLIAKAFERPEYAELAERALAEAGQESGTRAERIEFALDRLFVAFGLEILRLVPGRVSTEVDARLSFDTAASIAKARRLVALYEQAGMPRERVLVKLASTWEGVQAARVLEGEGIRCNMTLLFSLAQARACAEAGATLVSPFVGRILDWHRKQDPKATFAPEADPGVCSVRAIHSWLKEHGSRTEVMGASFRNVGEILELAGCDLLTISPEFLAELEELPGERVRRRLEATAAIGAAEPPLDEAGFRWELNEDAMATEKLAEGIRSFDRDLGRIRRAIAGRMG